MFHWHWSGTTFLSTSCFHRQSWNNIFTIQVLLNWFITYLFPLPCWYAALEGELFHVVKWNLGNVKIRTMLVGVHPSGWVGHPEFSREFLVVALSSLCGWPIVHSLSLLYWNFSLLHCPVLISVTVPMVVAACMVSMKTSSSNIKALSAKPILLMRLISLYLAKMLIMISRAGFANNVPQ